MLVYNVILRPYVLEPLYFICITHIDKVYLDGSCGSKTEAGILFASLKRVGHLTHFYKDTQPMLDPLSVQMGPRISLCLQYEWARKFLDYKKCSSNN